MTDIKEVREWYATEVKERMEDCGLRPYHISNICKIESANVSGYLKGNPFPKLWKLILIAECLDCSVNDLLGYDEVEDVGVYERFLASKTYLDEDEFAVRFGRRLSRLMKETCTDSDDLHKFTGISVENIERWICDKPETLPTVLQLIRICDALDCTPSDLLGY